MTLKQIGEFGFIHKISRGCLVRPENVTVAIGDDAAAFSTVPDELTLVTTDLLIEKIHFSRNFTDGLDLGHKSLAVNLSDIAAMGGIPREAFVSIAVPENCELDYLEELYRGIKALAAAHNVNILGGDTTRAPKDLVINICVMGSVAPSDILTRDKAKNGDRIYCSGFLGHSRAGLHLLKNNQYKNNNLFQTLIDAHKRPTPQIGVGRFLAKYPDVKTAIDISDGLGADLSHICKASKLGARLYENSLPISDHLKEFCARFGFDPQEYALKGGEDYVLVFTIAPEKAKSLEDAYCQKFGVTPHLIGEIVATPGIEMTQPDGCTKPIESAGWDHFKVDA